MKIKLDPHKQPVKCKVRRYAVPQRRFLNKYVQRLVDYGFLIHNPQASWQAAPHLVPKSSKAEFRTTIDLRPVNSATISQAWPMPNIESELQDFSGSTCFATLDFCSGYWQLPLHPDSYDACGIICPQGTFSSTRVLQGLKNATAHFQSTIEPLFSELREHMKAWLDDFNLYCKSESELLKALSKFFAVCRERNLYLSIQKCTFFARSIKWCGRVINSSGFSLDPRNAESLKNIHLPVTADELCQFVHCCRWMSNAIPDFTRTTAPLVEILEEAYKKSGSRKKRSIKNMALSSLSWGARHESAFKRIQETLQNAIRLAYPQKGKVVCVYTDASERFWSGVVTQADPEELRKPTEHQSHEPLAFIGCEFKGSELNWSTYEKEGFAIFKVFERLDYLMLGDQPVHVFTDHRNLLYVFAPIAFDATLGKHVVSKVQRWAMYLSRFEFLIEHIDGLNNVFADILTRWAQGYRSEQLRTGKVCAITNMESQLVPAASSVIWPDLDRIITAQNSCSSVPNQAVKNSNGLATIDGKMWIPSEDVDLKLKLLVLSHCGGMGHRGAEATESILRESFVWENLSLEVSSFVKDCLHCLVTRSGEIVPRPLASALHGTKANEVVHIDYLYLGPDESNKQKYALVMRDDFSSFVWLWPCASATSEAAVDALASWISSFGTMEWVVTDQGPHFINSLLREITDVLHIGHHFTTAYCPWANGTVERVCREVLRGCKALLHEMKLGPKDWTAVIEAVQCVINHSPLKRLGARDAQNPKVYPSPLEVFTGHLPSRPLIRALPIQDYVNVVNLEITHAKQVINIDRTQEALEDMHRDVLDRIAASRKSSRDVHNRKTGIQPVNFTLGDFVLIRRSLRNGHKLSCRWIGPKRVIEAINSCVYTVEDLRTCKKEVVHSRRMILYRSDMDGKEVTPELLEQAKLSEESYQVVEKIVDIRRRERMVEVLIQWKGLPDTVDHSWERTEQVQQDIPGMLEDFLHSAGKRALKKSVLSALFE